MSEAVRTVCRVQSRICVGGPARQTILLSARLDARRYRTILIGGQLEPGEADLSHEARKLGVPTILVPEIRRAVNPLMDLLAYWTLCRIFLRERPVLVHTHTAKAGAIGRLAALTTGVPIVIHTFHGHVFDGYFSRGVTAMFKLVERTLARSTDLVIAISEGQKRELCERHRIAPPEKVRVVPLGLELGRFLEARLLEGSFRRELGLGALTPLIGFVGRLAEIKDPELLLLSVAKLGAVDGAVPHVVIAGDGEVRPRLESLARELGIAERTHFLGNRSDVERVYADLDTLALTSRNEGTPVALIEAMAVGIPIVATDVGGVREVLGGYPLAKLVPDRSPESFATALRAWVRERICRTDGRLHAERFSAERLLREIEQIYEEMLANHSAASLRDEIGEEAERAA